MKQALRVIKLGGSLLDFEALVPQFRLWRTAQSPAVDIVVVGGGRLVEAIRHFDRIHRLTDEAAHWVAIKAMGITAELFAGLLSEATLIRDIDELLADSVPRSLYVLDVWEFLKKERLHTADALPECWQVTSDSIAARLARSLSAAELVLLKSALPARDSTLCELSTGGYVDQYFQQALGASVPVCFVNLRASGFPTLVLKQHDEKAGRHESQQAAKS